MNSCEQKENHESINNRRFETFTIQLSEDTTLTIDLFSPTGKSKELSIYLENPESIQDLVLIREKQDVDFQPDSSMLEILVWGDSDNEDFTIEHLVISL